MYASIGLFIRGSKCRYRERADKMAFRGRDGAARGRRRAAPVVAYSRVACSVCAQENECFFSDWKGVAAMSLNFIELFKFTFDAGPGFAICFFIERISFAVLLFLVFHLYITRLNIPCL